MAGVIFLTVIFCAGVVDLVGSWRLGKLRCRRPVGEGEK
jgi:hypothetical protein